MPWVWSDELADCLEGLGDVVEPVRIRHWRSAPTAYAVPAGLDLAGFAKDLLGMRERPTGDPARTTSGAGGESGPSSAESS
jgi:hypothetical protein